MQVSVERIEGLEHRMTVELPVENLNEAVQSKLRALARSATIKGFRPGKVPMRVLESRYGGQARREAYDEAIQSSFYEALSREKLRPAGRPEIEPMPSEPGKGVRYTATFEIYPDFELASFSGISIDKPQASISDEDVDSVIETIRRQRVSWNEVARPAQEGDRLRVDFTGNIDGEPFEGGEGKDVPVVLGSGNMIPGFEEQLTGTTAGNDVTVEVTFPDDYPGTALAGKSASFAVRILAVEEPEMPEVDEAFIRSFGVEEGTMDMFRVEVRGNMQKEIDQVIRDRVRKQIMDNLVEGNHIDVPRALVDEEAARLAENMRKNLLARGVTEHDGADLGTGLFEKQARKRVVLGLVIAEIIRKHELKADPDRVRGRVEQLASSYDKPEEVMNWYFSQRERLAEVEAAVLEDRVIELVLEEATVNEKDFTFRELMYPQSTGETLKE